MTDHLQCFQQSFGEISDRVAEAAAQQGLIEAGGSTEELDKAEADVALPHGSILFGTNARSRARRAREVLGWEPREEGLEAEIPRAVAEEAKLLAEGGSS